MVACFGMKSANSPSRPCLAWSLVTSSAFHPSLPGLRAPRPHLALHVLFPVGPCSSHAHCLHGPSLSSSSVSYSAADPSVISLPHSGLPRTLNPQGPRGGASQKRWSNKCMNVTLSSCQVGWGLGSRNLNKPFIVVGFHKTGFNQESHYFKNCLMV